MLLWFACEQMPDLHLGCGCVLCFRFFRLRLTAGAVAGIEISVDEMMTGELKIDAFSASGQDAFVGDIVVDDVFRFFLPDAEALPHMLLPSTSRYSSALLPYSSTELGQCTLNHQSHTRTF